eukprot:TRINITY_DN35437_c0_g1_i1.p1 TRINITY_DN35437_c0_g1~~TRINITY_DN35437_c0_g1_i1.p1  ORF type:complete len:1140 (-),score=156.00 TRINITY_DN35437_c0_g1_i1:340-3759(-)
MKSVHRRLATLISIVIFSIAGSSAEEDTCTPSDFIRTTSACSGGTRGVTYEKARNCTSLFTPAATSYNEACTCIPGDYVASFEIVSAEACSLTYTPTNCEGGKATTPIEVSAHYCAVQKVPCTQANVRSAYLPCDSVQETVEVVFYFDQTCNPLAPGSSILPPNDFIPCGLHCAAGTYLDGQACWPCKPGTYSMGGGIRLESFTTFNNATFKTSCTYQGANGTSPCTPWRVSGGTLAVGPYDEPNEWFQDECATQPALNCHNNLKATLSMQIKLVRDGYVRFTYMVDAERGYDGLSFYIDSDTASLPMDSYEVSLKEEKFELASGYHTLSWVFTKDEKWTRGKDTAAINLIEIDGTDFNDQGCSMCPVGTFSAEAAATCTPCPVGTFANTVGSATCTACPADKYSPSTPRTNCTLRPTCDLAKDATVSYGSCQTSSMTQEKVTSWLQPQICMPTSDSQLPATTSVKCAECPGGQIMTSNSATGFSTCQLCPNGESRAPGEAKCHACGEGQAAVRVLTLAHFTTTNGSLPDGFTTGCSGDCGTDGWRAVNGYLDSGSGHGNTVSVWLALNVTMEMAGNVKFNFSVDIPQDDSQRGMFFYVDDALSFDIEDGGYGEGESTIGAQSSGTIELTTGVHSLMWVWVKLNADPDIAARDSTIIYDISVEGESRGGAEFCIDIPEGATASTSGTAWVACAPGTYSTGGSSLCLPCEANTYNPASMGGPAACRPCGAGTSSKPGSTDCTIGDVGIPASYCTYAPPVDTATIAVGTEVTLFDMSPFDRLHPSTMFGPVYENSTAPDKADQPLYYINPCRKLEDNVSCVDVRGRGMSTYMCRVWAKNLYDQSSRRPANSLGSAISLSPLSSDPLLARRGFVMSLEGEPCTYSSNTRRTNITFVCDPDSGYGMAEAWTEAGRTTLFDTAAPFPWVKREGPSLPVQQLDYCTYSLVWYSAYACPICSTADYEPVEVKGCNNNKQTTYRFKDPKVCQSSPISPFPTDVPCEPCSADDYVEDEQICIDTFGRHNTTYRWNVPMSCNPALPKSAALPPNIVAGPCDQNVTVIGGLTKAETGLVGAGALLIVVLLIFSMVTYIRSRRIYSEYAKLLQSEKPGEFALEGVETASDGGNEHDEEELRDRGGKYSDEK